MKKLRPLDKPATHDKLPLNYASDEENLISIFLASMYALSIRFNNVFYLHSLCSLILNSLSISWQNLKSRTSSRVVVRTAENLIISYCEAKNVTYALLSSG